MQFHCRLSQCSWAAQNMSLCTFPVLFHCLSSPKAVELHRTFPVHFHYAFSLSTFPMQLSCAERRKFHCALSLRIYTDYFPYAVELCRTQRLYRKNPSQGFREKRNRTESSYILQMRAKLHLQRPSASATPVTRLWRSSYAPLAL